MKVNAYIPFSLPFPREGIDKLVAGSLRQFEALSGVIKLGDKRATPLKFRRVALSEARTKLSSHHNFESFNRTQFFEISSDIDPATHKFRCNTETIEERNRISILHSNLANEITFLVHKVVIACNVARPGSVNIGTGYIFFDGKFHSTLFGLYSNLNLLSAFGAKVEWPKLRLLRIRKVWDWLSSCDDFREGHGRGTLGRSLAAFSYLFVNQFGQESPLEDLWVIVGLEAIFGSNGSQRELATKAELFLGHSEKYPNWAYDLYKSRSKLIHGGASLPFSIADDGVLEEFEQYLEKRMDMMDRSVPCLLGVFQKMCILNIQTIEFETRVVRKTISRGASAGV